MSTITQEQLKGRPLSFSSLKEFVVTPQHYIRYISKKDPPTPAMLFGGVCHQMILEPDKFKEKYIVEPEVDKRTTKGKEDYASFLKTIEGTKLTSVPNSVYLQARELYDAFMKSPISAWVKRCNKFEQRFDITHETGLPVCGYLDGEEDEYTLEIKIVQSAVQEDVMRDFYNRKYHLQGGIYNFTNGKPILYVTIENSAPFLSRAFFADEEYIKEGKRIFNKAMVDFKYCMEMDLFASGYEFYAGFEPGVLSLPGWAKKGGSYE